MAGTNIFGELVRAQLENQASDPSAVAKGSLYYDTTLNVPKYSNGSAYKYFLDITPLTSNSAPDISADSILTYDNSASIPKKAPIYQVLRHSGAQGRLTLTTALAVTTADVTGATTVYFTPYRGNLVELYDGTNWNVYEFSELSQATTDNTKSPAAVANSKVYDIFVWNDSGTLRATRGPAWSSDTSRGTGAATSELEIFQGRYVNKVDITNGPVARRGLYVGTIRSDGSSQINDAKAFRHVWNYFNRVKRIMYKNDSTATWNYTTATWRQANGSSSNQLDFVIGISEDFVEAMALVHTSNPTGNAEARIGIALDATNTNDGTLTHPMNVVSSAAAQPKCFYKAYVAIGRHYLAWTEYSQATGTMTWYGLSANYIVSGIEGVLLA